MNVLKTLSITILSAALLAGCSHPTPCQLPDTEEYGCYTATRVSDGLWHLQDCNTAFPAGPSTDSLGNMRYNNVSDMYLVVGSEKALLIDLSNRIQWCDSADACLRHIVAERTAGKPLVITFTHNHGDHIGMLAAYLNDSAVSFLLPQNDFLPIADLFAEARSVNYYEEGYRFYLGGKTVSTVEVPGHTRGSMVFVVDGEDILLTGDAIGSGHGVWIFDAEGFALYSQAVPHLMAYVRNPENGIDTTHLRILGGHYHQKDWENTEPVDTLRMPYLTDMELAISEALDGTAETAPFEMQWRDMDTYFIHGSASIVAPKKAVEEQRRAGL